MFVYQNEKKQQQTLEKPTARFVVRGGRGLGPRPGRIAELVVNVYYVYKIK